MTKKQNEMIQISQIRDILHNLDPNNNKHLAFYKHIQRYYIESREAKREYAYNDKTSRQVVPNVPIPDSERGKITVGIGFNMDDEDNKIAWNKLLKGVNFDDVYNGRTPLTNEQIDILFEYILIKNEKYLKNWYPFFDQLRLNERLALEDLIFCAYTLVSPKTNFFKNMDKYYKTGDIEHLKAAIHEVQNRSNKPYSVGTQNRRNAQAELLKSYLSPFYSGPFDERLPSKYIVNAEIAKTIIPKGTEYWPKQRDSEYYIWRTQCDDKVRPAHLSLEGKIFSENEPPSFGHPGEKNRCRCYKETLPINIKIIEQKSIFNQHKYNTDMLLFIMEINQLKQVVGLERSYKHNTCCIL